VPTIGTPSPNAMTALCDQASGRDGMTSVVVTLVEYWVAE
jgi:hypothetical protein